MRGEQPRHQRRCEVPHRVVHDLLGLESFAGLVASNSFGVANGHKKGQCHCCIAGAATCPWNPDCGQASFPHRILQEAPEVVEGFSATHCEAELQVDTDIHCRAELYSDFMFERMPGILAQSENMPASCRSACFLSHRIVPEGCDKAVSLWAPVFHDAARTASHLQRRGCVVRSIVSTPVLGAQASHRLSRGCAQELLCCVVASGHRAPPLRPRCNRDDFSRKTTAMYI